MTDDQDIVYQDRELEAADEAAAVAAYWHALRSRNVDRKLADQLTRQYAFNLGGPPCDCDDMDDECSE